MSSEPPEKRYLRLRKALRLIRRRAKIQRTPFSVLCYGSASYGFNPVNSAKLDDLDLFLIIPPNITTSELVSAVAKLFPDRLEMNVDHVACLIAGHCEMCRLYSAVQGVKAGCRLLPYEVLRQVSRPEGCERPVRNIASLGQSRIMTDNEWSFAKRAYEPVTYENYSQTVREEELLAVVHRLFSKGSSHLGALGRKLLAAHVVHQAEGQDIPGALSKIWNMFVQVSRAACPEIANDGIIDSIMRSEKFSAHFRSRLSATIDLSR